MKMIKSRTDALQLKYTYMCLYACIYIYITVCLCIEACIRASRLCRIMSYKNWNFALGFLWGEAKWVALPQLSHVTATM